MYIRLMIFIFLLGCTIQAFLTSIFIEVGILELNKVAKQQQAAVWGYIIILFIILMIEIILTIRKIKK